MKFIASESKYPFPTFAIYLGLLLVLLLPACKQASQPASTDSSPTPAANLRPQYTQETESQRRPRRGRPRNQEAPGAFDFYLLNLSWSPEFCATHQNSSECGHGLGFVVHGLWPQNISGDYPEDCSDAPGPANPEAYTGLFPTASLVEHEWKTHGTCSGLSADAYFATVRKAFASVKIPANIGLADESSRVDPNTVLQSFSMANPAYPPSSLALSCGNNRLTAIEICLDKNLRAESCQGVRSCRANTIGITPKQ